MAIIIPYSHDVNMNADYMEKLNQIGLEIRDIDKQVNTRLHQVGGEI